MKKSTALSFALLLGCCFIFGRMNAQTTYIPFENGSVWSINNDKYMTSGDTTFNGLTYMKIYRQTANQPYEFDLTSAQFWGAVRNNTETQQVYFWVPAGVNVYDDHNQLLYTTQSDTELLFYDFSLALGDTAVCYQFEDHASSLIQLTVVRVEAGEVYAGYANNQNVYVNYTNADSLVSLDNGHSIKRMILSVLNNHEEYLLWYEGAGSSSGFMSLSDYYLVADMGTSRLICFSNAGGGNFQTEFDCSDAISNDCFSLGFGVSIQDLAKEEAVSVYPNPANDVVKVTTELPMDDLQLFNIQGQLVKSCAVGATTTNLNLSDQPAGIYLLRATMKDGSVAVQKVVKN